MTELPKRKENTSNNIKRIENIMKREIQEFQKGFEREKSLLVMHTLQLKYNENIRNYGELDCKLNSMKHNLSKVVNEFDETKNKLDKNLDNKNKELQNILEENKSHQVTIKNYQLTIDKLTKGLAQSERDMKRLNRELLDSSSKALEYDGKRIKLTNDLKKAHMLTKELKLQYESKIKSNMTEIQELKKKIAQRVNVYKSEVDSLNGELRDEMELKKDIFQQLHETYVALEGFTVKLNTIESVNSTTRVEDAQLNKREDYHIRSLNWNSAKEKLEDSVKVMKSRLQTKQAEIIHLKEQVANLKEKSDSHLEHLQYYKNKAMEHKRKFDETMNIQVKCTELSGKYDELMQKYEQLEKENLENESMCLKLSNDVDEQRYVKKEYDKEKKAYEALARKYEQLESENCLNKKKVEELRLLNKRLDSSEVEMRDMLIDRVNYLENELKDVSKKYADLVGHQNTKQKIKHFADLKAKNGELIQTNIDLELKVRTYLRSLEKLEKENSELKECMQECELRPREIGNVDI